MAEVQIKTSPSDDSNDSFSDEQLDTSSIKLNLASGVYQLTPMKGRSKVCSVFGRILTNKEVELRNRVGCRRCGAVLKFDNKSTSNLVKHKCYVTMHIVKRERAPVAQYQEMAPQFVKQNLGHLFAQWSVENCRLYSLQPGSGLRQFAEFMLAVGARHGPELHVDDVLPQMATLEENIEALFEVTFELIKNEIHEHYINAYGLAAHIWTEEKSQQNFITLTLHFAKHGLWSSRLLGITSLEANICTAAALETKMQRVLNNYDLQLIDAVVVMSPTVYAVKDSKGQCSHIVCISQLLHRVIERSLNAVVELKTLCKAYDSLTATASENENSPMLKDLYTLQNIATNWPDLETSLSHMLNGSLSLNFQQMQEISVLLHAFEQAMQKLEDNEGATLHLVFAYINGLQDTCLLQQSDADIIKRLKMAFSQNLIDIVMPQLTITHKIALFLFPPANKLLQFSETEKCDIKSKCAELLRSFSGYNFPQVEMEEFENAEEAEEETDCKKRKLISSYFKNFVSPTPSTSRLAGGDKIVEEINMYESLNIQFDEDFDVLMWWHSRQTQFPLLYQLSCRILATPATASLAGKASAKAMTILRDNLTSTPANSNICNQIVYLNINRNNYDYYRSGSES